MGANMIIRFEKLGEKHKKPVMEIYNYYVKTSTAAFPETPQPEDMFERFLNAAKGYPAYAVIEGEEDKVIAFCMIHAYYPHTSFAATAALTYFIHSDFVGKGIGSQCLEKLEAEAIQMGITNLVADISSENEGSINFHRQHGFKMVGELNGIGNKFGRDFGIVLMQKKLSAKYE